MPRSLAEWQEEIAANMLEDLAEASGIPLLDILASESEESLSNYAVYDLYEEETDSEPLDMQAEEMDIDDYLDEYVDERDIGDEEDAYGDEAI